MLKGIDISQYQPNVDFDVLKSEIDFVIIRASYGDGYIDKSFFSHQKGARKSGIKCGFYHYAYPQYNEPELEANWFLQTIGRVEPGEILCLDFEENWNGDVVRWCKRFLDEVSVKLGGFKPLIYLNRNLIERYDWSDVIRGGYSLWVASYDNDPGFVHFNTPWSFVPFKQYTDAGSVKGVPGKVDLDSFYGDLAAFKTYGYLAKQDQPIVQPELQNPDIPTIQKTTNQEFVDSLKSGKFLLSLTGVVVALINSIFDLKLTTQQLILIILPFLTLIVAEGLVDVFIIKSKLKMQNSKV